MWLAAQAAPAPAGDALLVSRFLPTREQSNNRIILHRTTSAKTPRPLCVRYGARRATVPMHRDANATLFAHSPIGSCSQELVRSAASVPPNVSGKLTSYY